MCYYPVKECPLFRSVNQINSYFTQLPVTGRGIRDIVANALSDHSVRYVTKQQSSVVFFFFFTCDAKAVPNQEQQTAADHVTAKVVPPKHVAAF